MIKNKKVFFGLFFVLLGIIFGLSGGSRGPVIAFFIAYLFCFIKFSFIRPNSSFKILTVVLVALFGLSIIFFDFSGINIVSRLNNIDPSDDVRFSLMSSGLSLYFDNFIIGAGIEPLGFYPHNIILEAFLACGLFTGIPLMILIFNAIRQSVFLFLKDTYYFWTIPLLIYTLIIDMVNGSLYQDYVFWCLITFFIMIPYHNKKILNKAPS